MARIVRNVKYPTFYTVGRAVGDWAGVQACAERGSLEKLKRVLSKVSDVPTEVRDQFMRGGGFPAGAAQKLFRVRCVYDQCGIWAFLALDTFFRMCNLQILKAVEKFDSRRLHQT